MYNVPSFTLARAIGGVFAWYWIHIMKRSNTPLIILASVRLDTGRLLLRTQFANVSTPLGIYSRRRILKHSKPHPPRVPSTPFLVCHRVLSEIAICSNFRQTIRNQPVNLAGLLHLPRLLLLFSPFPTPAGIYQERPVIVCQDCVG